MENENVKRLVNQYLCNMNFLRDDNNNYTIFINYNEISSCLFLQVIDGDSYSMASKANNSFKLVLNAKCNYLEAIDAINYIRDNFIENHSITIPEIGPMPIRINNTNYNYINCHHLRNTRFDLIITLKTENCFECAYIAQEKAKRKIGVKVLTKKQPKYV